MPLFGRRNGAPIASPANGKPGTSTGDGHTHRSSFSFGLWLRLFGMDIIFLALAGALGLGIYFAPPAYNRSFPVFVTGSAALVYPQFAEPLRTDLVPIWLAAFIAFMTPFAFFCLFQIRRRSLYDLLTTTLGLLKSLVSAALFQVFIKCLIGGLRPHFLAVCNPNVPLNVTGTGFEQIYYTREICRGNTKDVNDALESMPSGHSTAAFAGLLYLSLYLNAQLKLMSAHNPAYWKMLLFLAPILSACLIAGAMTIDGYHNWYDILAGAVIGTMCALIAFRTTFASVWDFRFNHILLPRTTSAFMRQPLANSGMAPSFHYVAGAPYMNGMDLPFTREGGWGWAQEMAIGAPFDASSLGAAGGFMSSTFQNLNGNPGTGKTLHNRGGSFGDSTLPRPSNVEGPIGPDRV